MRLSFLQLLTAPLLAFAAATGPNAFKVPAGGYSAKGGEALTLQWTPTTSGSVTLVLRSGSADNLDEGTVIAPSISNSGSYTWTPSNSLTSGTDYAIEIVDDADPSQVNYTPPFTLDTTTTEAQSTGIVAFTGTGRDSSILSHAPTTTSKPGKSSATVSSSISVTVINTFTSLHTSRTKGITVISHTASTTSGSAGSSASMAASTTSVSGAAARATAIAVGMVGVALGALAL